MSRNPAHILILEDIRETRIWLRDMVRGVFPASRITEAATRAEAMARVAEQVFDLALIDLNLPDGDGLDLLRHLAVTQPQARCVVSTVMARDSAIVAALSAGAEGYILKSDSRRLIARQLSQLSEGIPAISPPIARRIMEHFRLTGPSAESEGPLTPREAEVLALIARGLRVTDVAQSLGLADSTVASHVKSIYRKLGISNRAEATLHATRLGLLDR